MLVLTGGGMYLPVSSLQTRSFMPRSGTANTLPLGGQT